MAAKKQMVQMRQGDLFFERCAVPQDLGKMQVSKTPVLAEGEVTGHAHRIAPVDFANVDIRVDGNGDMYITAKPGSESVDVVVTHDEHAPVRLTDVEHSGYCYRVSRQREYDATAREQERRVAD